MAKIKMPVTPRSAYNPNRPANALLLHQARELEKAVATAGREVQRKKPRTEEQVASYIRHLNRALHQQLLLPKNIKRRPLDVPMEDSTRPAAATRRRKTRSARTRRRSRS
jgi:hypothetical protein